MKKFITISSLLASLFVLASFLPEPYYDYTPVYMKRDDLASSVKYVAGHRDLISTGKIYLKDNYLFINQPYKGVYVVNNSNPAQPVVEGFITAPGCIDMAVKGAIMYLDNSVDLVAVDLNTKQVTKRLSNALPEPLSPDGRYGYSREGYVVVEWKKR